jgi:hypothetical protein
MVDQQHPMQVPPSVQATTQSSADAHAAVLELQAIHPQSAADTTIACDAAPRARDLGVRLGSAYFNTARLHQPIHQPSASCSSSLHRPARNATEQAGQIRGLPTAPSSTITQTR